MVRDFLRTIFFGLNETVVYAEDGVIFLDLVWALEDACALETAMAWWVIDLELLSG